MKGILGRKIGMTQVFAENGKLIPVTVVDVEPNIVTQVKTKATDGYEAIQLGFSTKREKLCNKPAMGQFAKANTTPKRFLRELRGVDASSYTLGQELKADIFESGEIVDVTGISKGKGFQGVIKRFNQKIGPMGHGSQYHRGVGSMGTMRPMRVFKGKHLPGHMGAETTTIQNLEVVAIDLENNVILIKGNIPGAKKTLVIIKSANKMPTVKRKASILKTYKDETVATEEVIEEVIVPEVMEEVAVEVATPEETVEVNEETSQESEQQ